MIEERIMPEYRLCVVIEYQEQKVSSDYPEKSMLEIVRKKIEHKALFHGWIKRIQPHYDIKSAGIDDFIIKNYIGNDEVLIAIVEYEDGTIHEHLSQEIRFVDGKVNEYQF